MKIKTPVRFGDDHWVEDADGQALLELACLPHTETQAAIINTFEDAARWQFILLALDDNTSLEATLMNKLSSEAPQISENLALNFVKLVDAARAQLAAP